MRRVLGVFDATLLVVGSVFGSGIFLTTGIVAARLPFSGLIWLVWVAGGLITIAGALCYAELGSLFPRAGGPYVYIREAFGPASAFVFGWIFFWIIGGGGVAALAVGFAEYAVVLSGGGSVPLFAAAAVVGLTLINFLKVKFGAGVLSALTILRIGAVIGLIIGAAFRVAAKGWGHIGPLGPPSGTSPPSWTAFGAAFIAVFWAYDGWYSVNCAAEEVRTPRRTVPLSLVFGTGIVLLLYLAANIVYSIALPMDDIRGTIRIGEAAAASLFGDANAMLFTAVIAVAVFGCLGANILFCARVPFAMGRDGLFFKTFGRERESTGGPTNALLGLMVWACLLCLSGTYKNLIEFVMFAAVIFYAATAAAVIVIRRKMPLRARVFKVPGYPWIPFIYIIINMIVLISIVRENPMTSLFGAAIFLTSLPAYAFWKGRMKCLRS